MRLRQPAENGLVRPGHALNAAYPGTDALNRYARANNKYCTGDNAINNYANIPTTYIVRAPDGTPLSNTDNPAVCAITFSPYNNQNITDLLLNSSKDGPSTTKYGLENQLFASHYHKQFTICTINNPVVGDYILQVRTNALNPSLVPPTTVATSSIDPLAQTSIDLANGTTVGGHNRYTFRAYWGTDVTSGNGLAAFADGKLPLYVNVGSTPSVSTFYLAKISPEYAGKVLQLNFWDIADGGDSGVEILPPAETTGSARPSACTWTRDGSSNLGAATATNCKVTGMTNYWYNGKLVSVNIPLPDNYTCTISTGCWFKIKYTFSNGTPTDTTTWSANVLGDPVHLIL